VKPTAILPAEIRAIWKRRRHTRNRLDWRKYHLVQTRLEYWPHIKESQGSHQFLVR